MLATPRGITQPHTSFIGSACQGIHHTPVTKHTDTQTNRYKHQNTKKKDTRVHYTVLTQHNPTHNQPQTLQPCTQGPTGTTNAAPDTQQCTNEKPLLSRKTGVSTNPTPRSTHPNQAPPSPPSMTRRPAGMPPPGKNKNSGSHTLGDSTTHTHNCGHTK